MEGTGPGNDLQVNLPTYLLQLQQVEASLTTDPENGDLLKLKKDLLEVIELTQELVGTKVASSSKEVGTEKCSDEAADISEESRHNWVAGEKCMAIWSKDGGYYNAVVDEVLEDGSCTVTFDVYSNTELTKVGLLKIQDPNRKFEDASKSKKDLIAQQREYKRKKSQKKAQRQQKLEEERESEKNKWLDFNQKTFSRTTKGKVKKSIFATPENVHGRVGVGVGTCGVSGKPMTRYTHQEKWKK